MKRTFGAVIAGAMSLALLSGCGGPAATTSSAGGTASSGPIKIGLNFEESGAVASYGTAEAQGAKMAADEINAAGGINGRQIQVVEYDDKSDPAQATTLTTKLMTSDKVVTVIGPATSGGMKATVPVATKNQVPIISGSATADDLTVTNGKVNDYVFRTCFNDSFQGTAMAKYAASKLNVKSAVILEDTSSDYAKGLAASFNSQLTSGGGKIVDTQAYKAGDTDFNAVLTKFKGQTFDAIYLPGYYQEVGLVIAQARKLGITAPILGGDGYDSPKLAELAGAGLTDVYYTNHYSSADKDPKVVAFIDAYKKKFNAEPNAFNAMGYDTMMLVADAIKRAKDVTGPSIKDALASTKDFAAVTGTITIDPATHNPIKSVTFIGYKDGKVAVTEKA